MLVFTALSSSHNRVHGLVYAVTSVRVVCEDALRPCINCKIQHFLFYVMVLGSLQNLVFPLGSKHIRASPNRQGPGARMTKFGKRSRALAFLAEVV